MKFNKLKAFTLAEVMILLLTLSILLAAFAPVFTQRATTYSVDDVWTFVSGDDNNDAYFDVPNKTFTSQAFVGISPVNKLDAMNASREKSGANNLDPLYSKLVIRSNQLGMTYGNSLQNQMQFRYANSNNSAAGSLVGSLFAGNSNMLLGGQYDSIGTGAVANTAYGVAALSALKDGDANTAVGSRALTKLTSGSYNTVVGVDAAKNVTSAKYNTVIGNNSLSNASANNNYNTIVGYSSGYSGTGNTAIGNNALQKVQGNYNTAAGNNALKLLSSTTAANNTAIGYNAMKNLTSGSNNTAFGDNSCLQLTSGSNKTCIGSYSASKLEDDSSNFTPSSTLFNDSNERVFIGTRPTANMNGTIKPGAVLEVHNINSTNSNSFPSARMGNSSVVINGNLIVRGQSYLEFPIWRPRNLPDDNHKNVYSYQIPKGLVLFRLNKAGSVYGFSGYDGADRSGSSRDDCNGCRNHAFEDIRPNCICTIAGGGATDTRMARGTSYTGSTSYDWSSQPSKYNGTGGDCDANNSCTYSETCYKDLSLNQNICLVRTPECGNNGEKETDLPYAHMKGKNSCCPNLKSDIRLKNVGEKFTAGLDEIRKLNVYNFTFKNDPNKTPRVGVIAQDLKIVFPTAVFKDSHGYYMIRWDEMFYAAINSIKTLNSKIEKLASKIANDRERLAVLKKDNAELNARLDKLADELAQIEAKKK